jgi:hypothetical protein
LDRGRFPAGDVGDEAIDIRRLQLWYSAVPNQRKDMSADAATINVQTARDCHAGARAAAFLSGQHIIRFTNASQNNFTQLFGARCVTRIA